MSPSLPTATDDKQEFPDENETEGEEAGTTTVEQVDNTDNMPHRTVAENYKLSPLREPDISNRPNRRPSSGPEIDEYEPGGITDSGIDNGIDDGFSPNHHKPGSRRPSLVPDVFDPEQTDVNYPDIPTPDVNVYQHKKTLAQGMMDIALLSANANQLRYVLESGGKHPYYFPSLFLIGTSLVLQVAVGVGLILNSRYNVKKHQEMCKANKFNNLTVIAIFLVTLTNVFISAFGVADTPASEPIQSG